MTLPLPQKSQEEVALIQKALDDARRGGGSLMALARAHELASKHGLSHSLVELRSHIRAVIPNNQKGQIARSLGMGVASGILTYLVITFVTGKKTIAS